MRVRIIINRYFCSMKKHTIWLITAITAIALMALLFIQSMYFREVMDMCAEQFDMEVMRTLHRVSREVDDDLRKRADYDELTIDQRIDGTDIDCRLREVLTENGVTIQYHFQVLTVDQRLLYQCSDYAKSKNDYEYTMELFRFSPRSQMGLLKVNFPNRSKYIFETMHYIVPLVTILLLLLVMFVLTIWLTFKQKKLSEIKNNFIHNMTHELKTPISSISLAAQMLSDKSLPKTEQTVAHISTVIVDETRRLRFLVDKVLQMSMFDSKDVTTYNLKEVEVNGLITDIVNTFRLKVENAGGTIFAELNAKFSAVMADEMHLTNVLFNLMDNAVKYGDRKRKLKLKVTTYNDHNHIIIRVADNGIGIAQDDLKKVFEKFYRVNTGDRHDVKGFGLGLAYVKGVIEGFDGHIHAESTLGEGTRFIIRLPLVK